MVRILDFEHWHFDIFLVELVKLHTWPTLGRQDDQINPCQTKKRAYIEWCDAYWGGCMSSVSMWIGCYQRMDGLYCWWMRWKLADGWLSSRMPSSFDWIMDAIPQGTHPSIMMLSSSICRLLPLALIISYTYLWQSRKRGWYVKDSLWIFNRPSMSRAPQINRTVKQKFMVQPIMTEWLLLIGIQCSRPDPCVKQIVW